MNEFFKNGYGISNCVIENFLDTRLVKSCEQEQKKMEGVRDVPYKINDGKK